MDRTTVMLPDDLERAAQSQAEQRRISLGELIRESLRRQIETEPERRDQDLLFADAATWSSDVPSDLSEHHDDELYGESGS
jgi:hypothetical protein